MVSRVEYEAHQRSLNAQQPLFDVESPLVDDSPDTTVELAVPANSTPAMHRWVFPDILADLVARVVYKDGWRFELTHLDRGQGSEGLTLVIYITTQDSYHPDTQRTTVHYFPCIPAAYDRRSWQRWLFDQIVLVETHEAMEFYCIEGTRPFAPHHGPGRNPYSVHEIGTDEEVRTSFRGTVSVPVG